MQTPSLEISGWFSVVPVCGKILNRGYFKGEWSSLPRRCKCKVQGSSKALDNASQKREKQDGMEFSTHVRQNRKKFRTPSVHSRGKSQEAVKAASVLLSPKRGDFK